MAGQGHRALFLPAVRMTMPEVIDYDLPFAGRFTTCCIVSIRKAYPGHARKVMHAIWGTGLMSLTKGVVVVDEGIDVHDYAQVMWQVGANVDPARDVVLSEGPWITSTTRPRASSWRKDRHRCHRQDSRRGLRPGLAGHDRDDARGARVGHPPVG